MSHRIVSAVVVLVLLLFGGAGVLFAVGVTPPRSERDSPGAAVAPATHRTFGEGTCTTCHRPGESRRGEAAPGSPNWPGATATGRTTPKKDPAYGM